MRILGYGWEEWGGDVPPGWAILWINHAASAGERRSSGIESHAPSLSSAQRGRVSEIALPSKTALGGGRWEGRPMPSASGARPPRARLQVYHLALVASACSLLLNAPAFFS
jgi:hypothetical protein